jgi:hypothetical protein
MSHVKKYNRYALQQYVGFSSSPTHSATRAHTAVNVTAVTSRYHGAVREISNVTRNKRRLRHIHVNNKYCFGQTLFLTQYELY